MTRLLVGQRFFVGSILFVCIGRTAFAAPVPADAKAVILRVAAAAKAKDLAALSSLMVSEFRWSFGGDASLEQALAEWKRDPKQLDRLARITALPCAVQADKTVECPKKAGQKARAGFQKTAEGWRMIFFVEGD